MYETARPLIFSRGESMPKKDVQPIDPYEQKSPWSENEPIAKSQ